MNRLMINQSTLGKGYSTYIVAEMSANHSGSIEKAKQIIHAAKECGADAVKLQTYTADTITLDSDKKDFCLPSDNPWASSKTLHSLFQQAYTPWEWHEELFEEAKKIGIDIFSSPFDESAVDLLERLGACAYKIASPEITHIPLIRKVAKTKKPVIVSTGVALLEDIELALSTLRDNGCDQLILLKCTSSYPTPLEALNLNTMKDMGKRFNCLVGLSDHSLGIVAPIVSVALGASFIEKHFVLSKDDISADSFFSLDKKEFSEMVKSVRDAEKVLGKITYDLDEEVRKNFWGRRSLYVSDRVKKGDLVTNENVKCVRPHFGMHPKYLDKVLGKRFTKDMEKGERLSFDDIAQK